MAILISLSSAAASTHGKTDTAPPFQTPVESFWSDSCNHRLQGQFRESAKHQALFHREETLQGVSLHEPISLRHVCKNTIVTEDCFCKSRLIGLLSVLKIAVFFSKYM